MSQERNLKWLHDRRVIYARNPITDMPTESTDLYDYYTYSHSVIVHLPLFGVYMRLRFFCKVLIASVNVAPEDSHSDRVFVTQLCTNDRY